MLSYTRQTSQIHSGFICCPGGLLDPCRQICSSPEVHNFPPLAVEINISLFECPRRQDRQCSSTTALSFELKASVANMTNEHFDTGYFKNESMNENNHRLFIPQEPMNVFPYPYASYSSVECCQNRSSNSLYVNNSVSAEGRTYQTLSPSTDLCYYIPLQSSEMENLHSLPVASEPSSTLRNPFPANVKTDFPIPKLELQVGRNEIKLDAHAPSPVSADLASVPSYQQSMMDGGSEYIFTNNFILYPESDMQRENQVFKACRPASFWDLNSKKPCNCKRSQCLKPSCECFANSEFCNNCNCYSCLNNLDKKEGRFKAIKTYPYRKSKAFQPKIGKTVSEEVKPAHTKGCKCKRSNCLKNYCHCYEAKVWCSPMCKCINCNNCEENQDGKTLGSLKKLLDLQSLFQICTSLDVVRAVSGCLLARAEIAENEGQSMCSAEQVIIEEFGNCLTQMLESVEIVNH